MAKRRKSPTGYRSKPLPPRPSIFASSGLLHGWRLGAHNKKEQANFNKKTAKVDKWMKAKLDKFRKKPVRKVTKRVGSIRKVKSNSDDGLGW